MFNKLKADFTINIENVLKRVRFYPRMSKVIQPQLEELSKLKQPPLIEQVHKVIYWLNRYSDISKLLLMELEGVLIRIEGYEFSRKGNLLNNFGVSKNESNFNSAYSELFLTNFFIKNGIKLIEYEPLAKNGKYRADFKICFGIDNSVMVELVTPGEKSGDFDREKNFLLEKLEQVHSGLSIQVNGFESYDRSNRWRTKVEPPTHKQIEEIVSNFRKGVSSFSNPDLPKELPPLCSNYPRIKVKVLSIIPNYKGTKVYLHSSRSGEGFPFDRIMKLILDERKHLSPNDSNLVFVDFSNWSRIDRIVLEPEVNRKKLIQELERKIPSKIDGVLTYIRSNQKDEGLINRRILYLNSNKPVLNKNEVQGFLKLWESTN